MRGTLLGLLIATGCGAPTAEPARVTDSQRGSWQAAPGIAIAPLALGAARPVPPARPRLAEHRLSEIIGDTAAAQAVLAQLASIRSTMTDTVYQGAVVARPREGIYKWDCSGMVAWVLRQAAPRARRALADGRPRAKDFVRHIERSPIGAPRRGWERVATVADARPGDLFAFRRSRLSTSSVTGHVGFLLEAPRPLPGLPRVWVARIADSTRTPHEDDTRRDDPDGGSGFGTMAFLTDETGATIAYGWQGVRSATNDHWLPTSVVFGRVHP